MILNLCWNQGNRFGLAYLLIHFPLKWIGFSELPAVKTKSVPPRSFPIRIGHVGTAKIRSNCRLEIGNEEEDDQLVLLHFCVQSGLGGRRQLPAFGILGTFDRTPNFLVLPLLLPLLLLNSAFGDGPRAKANRRQNREKTEIWEAEQASTLTSAPRPRPLPSWRKCHRQL